MSYLFSRSPCHFFYLSFHVLVGGRKQHFEVVQHFHPNGQEDLRGQVERDLLKNREVRRRGWSLLRIGYPRFKDLEAVIDEFLLEVGRSDEQLYRGVPVDLYTSIPCLV